MRQTTHATASPPREAERGNRSIWPLICGTILLAIISLPTLVVMAVGLLPSIVALIVDRTPRQYAVFAVGGLNLAGLAPSLVGLWFEGGGMAGAVALLTDPFALVIMYGAAGLGWVLFLGLPMLTTQIEAGRTARQVARLRARQRALTEEWGEEVAADRGRAKDARNTAPRPQ